MFHAVLTSSSFSSDAVRECVESLVRERGFKGCAMVTTAHPKKERAPWVEPTVAVFEAMGVSVRCVDLERGEQVEGEDIVYVCGGNTPRLLAAARESAFKAAVLSLAERGGLYIGSSAGAVLLSPSIDAALEIHPADENAVGLTDFTGLEIVPFHLVVHYEDGMREQLEAFELRHEGEEVIPLRNGEAVVVRGEEREFVGL